MIQVGENVSFDAIDAVGDLGRGRGIGRRLRGRKVGLRRRAAMLTAPVAGFDGFGDFEDFSGTSILTISEDASLEDLAEFERLSYLDSLGQLDELGKFSLKKIAKKITAPIKKVVKAVKKGVKTAVKVGKKAVKLLVKINPAMVMLKAAQKAGKMLKKLVKRKKSGGGEEIVYEDVPSSEVPAGIPAATWNAMTPEQQQAFYDKQTAQEQAAYDAQQRAIYAQEQQQALYAQQQPITQYPAGGGGGAPSSAAYWPVEEPQGAETEYPEDGGEQEYAEDGTPVPAAVTTALPIKSMTNGGGAATAAAAGGGTAAAGPTPVWVWPTVIVGGVAIVGIASYFMFFRKPKATVKV